HYVMERTPYQHTPLHYREFGFTKTSEFPTFSRDDFRNINMIEISRGYERAAFETIRRNPGRYLKAMFGAYAVYANPPGSFEHMLELPRGLLKALSWTYENVIYGKILTEEFQWRTRLEFGSLF